MKNYCDECRKLYTNTLDKCPHCCNPNDKLGRKPHTTGVAGDCVMSDHINTTMPTYIPQKRDGRAIPTVRSIIKTKPPATSEWIPFVTGDWGIFGGLLKQFHAKKYHNHKGGEKIVNEELNREEESHITQ
jgi:hypothetical protein